MLCNRCKKERSEVWFYFTDKSKTMRRKTCKICHRESAMVRDGKVRNDVDLRAEKSKKRKIYWAELKARGYKRSRTASYLRLEHKNRHIEKFPEKERSRCLSMFLSIPFQLNKHHWSYRRGDEMNVFGLSRKDHRKIHGATVYDKDLHVYRRSDNLDLLDTVDKCMEFYKTILNKQDPIFHIIGNR